MSHCIGAYICKKEELKIPNEIKSKNLPQGFIIFDELPARFYAEDEDGEIKAIHISEVANNICYVSTDYFGGFGEQSAKLWLNGKRVPIKDKQAPIDEALAKLGVQKERKKDEFDTIGLGQFRSNNDIWYDEPEEVAKREKENVLVNIGLKILANLKKELKDYNRDQLEGFLANEFLKANKEHFNNELHFKSALNLAALVIVQDIFTKKIR